MNEARDKPFREGFQKVEDDDVAPVKKQASQPSPPPKEEPLVISEWPLTIDLMHKPVEKNPGEMVNQLVFREPTAGDLMRAGGNPCRVEVIEISGGNITWQPVIDDNKMIRLMASLCGVLEPYLMKMDPRDYSSCAHRLRRFFLPEQGIW